MIMTVTRDVIYDLLPIYFAGQVSEDTKALVAEFFKADPEFARMAERFATLSKDQQWQAGPDREGAVLARTRRFVRYRNQLIGLAIAYSLLPFTFYFRGGEVVWVMLRDRPQMALMFGIAGIGCWIAAYMMSLRSRRTGL
jgi:hypothetical protein